MKLKNLLLTLIVALATLSLSSCEESGKDTPKPAEKTGSIDLWIPLGGLLSSMEGKDAFVILKADDLSKGVLTVKGKGADISSTSLTSNVVYRNGYYYSVSREGNFGKFRISDTAAEMIKEIPTPQVLDRRFAHAWIDDSHIVLVGAAGKKQAVNWVLINTNEMRVEKDGQLELEAPLENEQFNSSGLLGYRKSDNTLIYVYVYTPMSKKSKLLRERRGEYYVAFIDASTMKVNKVESDSRAGFIGSTAYGDTQTRHTFTDAEGNFYYIACDILYEDGVKPGSSSTTRQASKLFRVKSGETAIDKTYEGYGQERGKITDVTVLGKEEVLLYVQDPVQATPSNPSWDSKTNPYVYFWQVLNLRTHEVTRLTDIPLCKGAFAQGADIRDGKVYIGANVDGNPSARFYLYDIKSRKLTKGATLAEGYEISRVMSVK
ncbi:MAG: hypothetical protein SPI16_04110 [Porphyromonas sp.]|uniref:hypothetical protein n=1 Tax=Porphyromonas sp. TaxID=1924944 RepID=UPI002A91E0D1|nr:hypothetical protein [Porphyromonas sp.]MDD7468028.1 hypothetical protein [Bacteroidales bacterium]MDY6102216.1 hypothetical protein [Porphyromonas sp.]